MIPLPEYAKIKDNYCIAYFGYSKEYLVQLRLLRPYIEEAFPGIQIYLCCKDDLTYLFKDEPRTLDKSTLMGNKKQFAYIREISYKKEIHPVEELMDESEIEIKPISTKEGNIGSAVLLTNCCSPVKSLNHYQIKSAIQLAELKNCTIAINEPYENYDWVIGVENEQLYEAAAQGKKVTLIPTGIGENLFKKMFPFAEIVEM
jgi:hypothetical protein